MSTRKPRVHIAGASGASTSTSFSPGCSVEDTSSWKATHTCRHKRPPAAPHSLGPDGFASPGNPAGSFSGSELSGGWLGAGAASDDGCGASSTSSLAVGTDFASETLFPSPLDSFHQR